MGRYCYFSNGYEYKFWYAVQDSGFCFLEDEGVIEINIDYDINVDNYLENVDEDDKNDPVVRSFIKWAEEHRDDYLTTKNVPWRNRTRSSKMWNDCLNSCVEEASENFQMKVDREALLTYLQTFPYKMYNTDLLESSNDTSKEACWTIEEYIMSQFGKEPTNKEEEEKQANFLLGCIVYQLSSDNTLVLGNYEC
jgi:hypothetical protein